MARPNDSSRRDQPDIQWLERMYNNRLRVPDHGDYWARWTAESDLARRALRCDIDVPYGGAPHERLDAFAAARTGSPLVVFVPDGYWRGSGKSMYSFVAGALHNMGAAAVVPDYSPCPQASVTQITLQVARAVAWAWRHARELRADPRRVVVMGHSAGGQLAAMMQACAWPLVQPGLPNALVRRGMGISGLYDLEPLMQTPSLQEVLRLTPHQVLQASPARVPMQGRCHFYAVVGGDESGEYLRQTRLLQQAWGRERVPVSSVLPHLNHFSMLDSLVQPGSRLHGLARQLLHRAAP